MVVMSKGRPYHQQSYKVAAQFPSEWVRRKHNDGFMITCCGTIGTQDNYYWVVVVTAGTGFDSQAVELDFVYPSEAIHHYWDKGVLCLPADMHCIDMHFHTKKSLATGSFHLCFSIAAAASGTAGSICRERKAVHDLAGFRLCAHSASFICHVTVVQLLKFWLPAL